jgi:hypothetical protein
MRVHRGTNWTVFSATHGIDTLTLYLRRVFHPTRGEETQLEAVIEKKTPTKKTYTMKAAAAMTPDEARDFATIILGRFAPPAPPRTDSAGLSSKLNAYQPIEFPDKLTPREARLVKTAFLDGYDFAVSQGVPAPKTAP